MRALVAPVEAEAEAEVKRLEAQEARRQALLVLLQVIDLKGPCDLWDV